MYFSVVIRDNLYAEHEIYVCDATDLTNYITSLKNFPWCVRNATGRFGNTGQVSGRSSNEPGVLTIKKSKIYQIWKSKCSKSGF